MKKVLALLCIGSLMTVAACQSNPKTEATAVDSTTNTMSTDTTTMATDSASPMVIDSTSMTKADSAR